MHPEYFISPRLYLYSWKRGHTCFDLIQLLSRNYSSET